MSIEKYPQTIRWLHRIIALLMIGMIALGWYLSEIDYEAANYVVLRQLHRTIGLALFPLGVAHLLAYAFLLRPNLKPWEILLPLFPLLGFVVFLALD